MNKIFIHIDIRKGQVLLVLIFISMRLLAQQPLFVDSSQANKKDIIDIYRYKMGKNDLLEMRPLEIGNVQFSLLPSLGSSGGSDRGLITVFVTTFYLGDKRTTNMSNVYLAPYFTFSDQYVLPMRTYIWTANNKWNLNGDYRWMLYPQYTYGLGPNDNSEPIARLQYSQFRFYQNILKGIMPNLALGLGVQYDLYYNLTAERTISEIGFDSSMNSLKEHTFGPTVEWVYDTRGNTINPIKGHYIRSVFRKNLKTDQADDWFSLYFDARKYVQLNKDKHRLLAFWAIYWAVLDGKAFYLDLPSIGWDYYNHSGRGILRNRYRSTSLIYLETEYRTEITNNGLWGCVVFANLTAPAVLNTYQYPSWYWAIGGGLRLKYNKFSGSNILMDVAFSRDYWTWYFGLSEYF